VLADGGRLGRLQGPFADEPHREAEHASSRGTAALTSGFSATYSTAKKALVNVLKAP